MKIILLFSLFAFGLSTISAFSHDTKESRADITVNDSITNEVYEGEDTVGFSIDPSLRHGRLTEQDFIEVAAELGVEVAAIKAVVEIEAGKSHNGFWSENKPLINFDLSMFRKMANKNKISLAHATKEYPVIFSRPNITKYGSEQAAQQARLDAARLVDDLSAVEGTFWGMFQIGGFNYKLCGCESVDEFVKRTAYSELEQLQLFAVFITNSGMVQSLRNKDWATFARKYNGPSYAKRGYHTKMAKAYAVYSKL